MGCESRAIIQVIMNALAHSSHHTTKAMLQGFSLEPGKLQEDLSPVNVPKQKYPSGLIIRCRAKN